jgi:hypothetical protein
MSATIISAPPARTAFVDRELHAGNGYVMLGIGLALIAISCWLVYTGFVVGHSLVRACIALPAIIFAIAVLKGLVVVQPNRKFPLFPTLSDWYFAIISSAVVEM